MPEFEAEFIIERETKNTVRYMAKAGGQPPAVRTIYIEKWFLGDNPPKTVKLRIET
jgi:hypothetical protein